MIEVQNSLLSKNLKSKMLLQVHDELVFDAHKEELVSLKSIIKEKMEKIIQISVPLEVDIGTGINWLEAH